MNRQTRIYIAGHRGLVGSAVVRRLRALGYEQLLVAERGELELTRQADVEAWFAAHRPEVVILAAARVGGILANNSYPADFIRDNLVVQNNVIDAAYRNGARKLTFLGSSCIYPKAAPQPLDEDSLLTGPLEPTNEWYAIAKIAGIKMCQAYQRQYGFDAISLMPTNLYGPGDNFGLESSHVLPALIRKFHEARREGKGSVVIWGTGTPRREFLYVDDLADAVVFLTQKYSGAGLINIGVGEDVTIRELAERIGRVVGFQGDLVFDSSKPDGTPRKLLNVNRLLTLGWQATTTLDEGLRRTYEWFCANEAQSRR
ncbi:MAG TPA: GDP-L-fucose synthase [Steroidobacteraceae bacterium]|nr:GDP-L-fucose synthase [Steroidobacteraceae bacterium]